MHIEVMREHGEVVPPPAAQVAVVQVASSSEPLTSEFATWRFAPYSWSLVTGYCPGTPVNSITYDMEVDVSVGPTAVPSSTTPAAPRSRVAASGPCGCARRSCWHSRGCKSNAVVRIFRAPDPEKSAIRPTVLLCRECAAPTQRNRVA